MKYDVFISYRRTASETATLITEKLRSFGYRVFLDVETLNSGKFNEQLLNEIAQCKDFLVVLPENALDRCAEAEDWVRQEICCAMRHNKNIIPIMLRNFSWPDIMPEGMEELKNYQAVTATSPEYFDLAMQRLAGYLKSRPHTKYRMTMIRASIVTAAITACLLIAYAAFRMVATPVCTDVANSLTSEMETINQLAGINQDIKQDWDDFFRLLLSAQTPQRLQDLQNGMLASLGHHEESVKTLQAALPYSDFRYSDYKAFLLSLYNIDVAELQASATYTGSMFDDLFNNIDFIRNSIGNINAQNILNKSMIDNNFVCYQSASDAFYYGYMELMSLMPQKSRANYEKFSVHWGHISHAVPLSLSAAEYQQMQQREFNKMEQAIKSIEINTGKASEEVEILAQKVDKLSAMLPTTVLSDDAQDLMSAEINARLEKLAADREYVELRKRELAEIERKYEGIYNKLREQCQLKENELPDYMWGKVVHWGRFLGKLTTYRKNAEQQGVYSTSAVTPARALAEMNSLLSCYQTYNPASSVFIPSVKTFFQEVVAGKYPLAGVLIFGFKDNAEHPLYKAGDIVIERNGVSTANYSQLTEAAKLIDGGTVKFLRLEDGKLCEHSENVPKSEVLVGYMELTESE